MDISCQCMNPRWRSLGSWNPNQLLYTISWFFCWPWPLGWWRCVVANDELVIVYWVQMFSCATLVSWWLKNFMWRWTGAMDQAELHRMIMMIHTFWKALSDWTVNSVAILSYDTFDMKSRITKLNFVLERWKILSHSPKPLVLVRKTRPKSGEPGLSGVLKEVRREVTKTERNVIVVFAQGFVP